MFTSSGTVVPSEVDTDIAQHSRHGPSKMIKDPHQKVLLCFFCCFLFVLDVLLTFFDPFFADVVQYLLMLFHCFCLGDVFLFF